MNASESQKRFKPEKRGRVCVFQRVLYQQLLLFPNQQAFFGQHNSTNPVSGFGNNFNFKITDILVPLGFVAVSVVFVNTQIEGSAMLNHRFVQ